MATKRSRRVSLAYKPGPCHPERRRCQDITSDGNPAVAQFAKSRIVYSRVRLSIIGFQL